MAWAAPFELQIEDGAPFAGIGQGQQEDLIEAALAQQFGRQALHPIGGGHHEHGAGLFGHPGEQAGQHPLARATVAAAIAAQGGAETLVDLIDPEHAGGHRLRQLDHLAAAGLTGPHQAAEQAAHIEAQQGHGPAMGDRLGRERLARALGAHQQHPPGQGQAVAARPLTEGLVPLRQPLLEGAMAADVGRAGATGAILEQLAAGDRLALLLQHLGQVVGAELAAPGQAPGGHLADALFAEAAAALAELVEHRLLEALAAGLGDAGQQGPDLRGLR